MRGWEHCDHARAGEGRSLVLGNRWWRHEGVIFVVDFRLGVLPVCQRDSSMEIDTNAPRRVGVEIEGEGGKMLESRAPAAA